VLSFDRAVAAVIIVALGGAGTLVGPMISAALDRDDGPALLVFLARRAAEPLGFPRSHRKRLRGVPSRVRLDPLTGPFALETHGLSKRFGSRTVADAIDFSLPKGARQALIGPNGAGKSTFVNLLTGMLWPTSGAILLDGHEIGRLSPERRVRRGLAPTFQIRTLARHSLELFASKVMPELASLGEGGAPAPSLAEA
jgi:ABC-type multidrug transport system fused ATPase/permease subunit